MPKISIILPIYEVERYVEQCVRSIRTQTFTDLEVICVNDATMDNSVAVLKNAIAGDRRFRIVHNNVNRGLGGARNAGLDVATGDYVQFVDSDDWLHRDMVKTLLDSAEANSADWVSCAPYMFDNGATSYLSPFHATEARQLALMGPLALAENRSILLDLWPSMWLGLRRRDVIGDLRFPQNRFYEDHEFHFQFGLQARNFVYLERPLYYYRIDNSSRISRDNSARSLEIFAAIDEVCKIIKSDPELNQCDWGIARYICRILMERFMGLDRGSEVEQRFIEGASGAISRIWQSHKHYLATNSEVELTSRADFLRMVAPDFASEEFLFRLFAVDKASLLKTSALTDLKSVAPALTSPTGNAWQRFVHRIRTRRERRAKRIARAVAAEMRKPL